MPITRDFSNNGQFNVVDWSQEINVVPNQWGTIGQLDIFQSEPVASSVVQFEEIIKDGNLIIDRVRGDRPNVGRDYTRKLHSFLVPHFPTLDAIYPEDVVNKRAYGSATQADTEEAVRMRRIERMRQNLAWTLEAGRAWTIVNGTAYSPGNTVSQDFYQEFTQAARPAPIDFVLGTPTTEVLAKSEQAIAQIQDSSGSVSITGIVALCGSDWFSKLISHASVKVAYQYYSSTQEPLRQRLSAGGSAVPYRREFYHGGIRYIEMRDQYAGQLLIPKNEAYFLPTGTEFFKTYFSPASRFGLVNTMGEELYMFEKADPNGTVISLEAESNFLNALMKPLLVVKAISSN